MSTKEALPSSLLLTLPTLSVAYGMRHRLLNLIAIKLVVHSVMFHTFPLLKHSPKVMAAVQNETTVRRHPITYSFVLIPLFSSGVRLYFPKSGTLVIFLSRSYRPS